jgi:biotin-[acetyl-CoA-carboxylase] ligase BirA-like protein
LFKKLSEDLDFTEVQECESTQDLALNLALKYSQAQLVLSEFQTKGRGRQGSLWLSENHRSFTCSLALQIPAHSVHSSMALIPHLAGLAMWKTLFDIDSSFESLFFKWPNDLGIFVGHEFKKTAGILVEIKKNILIVGWGLNVFSPAPLSNAIALDQLKNNLKFNKEDFACRLANHFLALKKAHQTHKEAFEDKFLEFLFSKLMHPLWGRSLQSKLGEGRAIGLGKEGSLIIQSIKKEIVEIKSGEIILK